MFYDYVLAVLHASNNNDSYEILGRVPFEFIISYYYLSSVNLTTSFYAS
jgi:hypothetical protein